MSFAYLTVVSFCVPSEAPWRNRPQPAHEPLNPLGGGILVQRPIRHAQAAAVPDAEGVPRDDGDAELADEALDRLHVSELRVQAQEEIERAVGARDLADPLELLAAVGASSPKGITWGTEIAFLTGGL